MTDRSRVLAVTGDDVVRFTLSGKEAVNLESVLDGVGAQCVAVDPHDPELVYVGSFDHGIHVSRDGGSTWNG